MSGSQLKNKSLIIKLKEKALLNGLGELMDKETKNFVRTRLKQEVLSLLRFYPSYPMYNK